ncbi:MAG: 3'-5' exonuclease [Nanoarchaeota archaeon]
MIVVDVETTGIDPKKHSIVSIGAVSFYNPENQFYDECRIWEGAETTEEALNINGFSEEETRNFNKKTLEEAIKKFWGWTDNIKNKIIAGENPNFDRDFLKASAERYGIKWVFGYRTVDLHSLCYINYLKRKLNPPDKLNTDKTLNYVGMPSEPRPHNALTGAKMEAEAFSRIIYGKPLLKEFEKYPVPDFLKS